MDMTFVYQISHAAAFGPLVVLYLFLAGLSAGLFLLATLEPVFGRESFASLTKPASAMALAVIIPAGLCLLVDLGQPLRAIILFYKINLMSVMSWGTFILLFYSLVCTVYTWLVWTKDSRCTAWGKPGVVLAAALALYTGFLLAAAPAHPLWNSALLPILFLVSGLVAALSLLSLLQPDPAVHALKVWIVSTELALIVFHLLALVLAGAASSAVVWHLLTGARMVPFLVIQCLAGMILPLAILLGSSRSPRLLGLSGVLSLLGVLALRFNFVVGGEELPLSGTLIQQPETAGMIWPLTIGFLIMTFILAAAAPRIMERLTGFVAKPSYRA